MDIEDTIANLQRHNQMKATKALAADVRKLAEELRSEKQREAALPKCPWCGGSIGIGFEICKHCAREIAWVEEEPCKPADEASLRAEYERKLRMEEEEWAAIAARKVHCRSCQSLVPQESLTETKTICRLCVAQKALRKKLVKFLVLLLLIAGPIVGFLCWCFLK